MKKCQDLTSWVEEYLEGKTQECRACGIATLVAEYQKLLGSKGYNELTVKITKGLSGEKSSGDVILDIAKLLDSIKNEVDDKLKQKLHQIDCTIQEEIRKSR